MEYIYSRRPKLYWFDHPTNHALTIIYPDGLIEGCEGDSDKWFTCNIPVDHVLSLSTFINDL